MPTLLVECPVVDPGPKAEMYTCMCSKLAAHKKNTENVLSLEMFSQNPAEKFYLTSM